MIQLGRCDQPPGLEPWIRSALDPYLTLPDEALVEAPLEQMLDEVPVLLDPPAAGCVWSGRLGSVACWELRDERGQVVARTATAPRPDGLDLREIVRTYPRSYHQSAIGAGPGFLERNPRRYEATRTRDGPHFNGYILGDDLVGCLNVGLGTRLYLWVAQFPGAADYEGYWDGEALLARLDMQRNYG